jgi:hypothetical protein
MNNTVRAVMGFIAMMALIVVSYVSGLQQGRNELKAYQIGLELSGHCH